MLIDTMEIIQPKSVETEVSLIGSVLRGGREAYQRIEGIIYPPMFWSDSNRAIWSAIQNTYDSGMEIDTVIIGDEIERMKNTGKIEQELGNGVWSGRALLTEIRRNGDPLNVETYAEQVQDYHFKRYLLELSSKMAGWSANGRRADAIMRDIEKEFSRISLFSVKDEYTVPLKEAVKEAYEWTDKASKGQVVGVPTGFTDLDKILGSLYGGNVYIVAGRPGQGKTAFLINILKNAAQKFHKRVAVFSLEMSRSQVAQRMIAIESEVDLNKIIRGSMEVDEWSKYTSGLEIVADLPIVINDLSSIDIGKIRQTARKIQADGGLDLVVVDYIQLAQSDGKRNERRELDVSEVSRGLKYLARELDVPVLVAAQLSREVERRTDKKPILSDLRESGSIEQDAYCVMFLYFEKDESNVADILIAKHRNGPTGSCNLIFNKPLTKFENASFRIFNPNEV